MNQKRDRELEGQASLDRVFAALSDPARRRILEAVRDRNPRRKDEFLPGAGPGRDHEAESVSIHHRHLPHLDEAGFVDWDRETDTITRGPAFDEIEPVLGLFDSNADALPADWP